MKTAGDILKKLTYPGRGIILGLTPDGENLAAAYFLTGRSENSRSRVLKFKKNRISVQPFNCKIENPSLVIYDSVAKFKNFIVISNGNHTETIVQHLNKKLSFAQAMRTRNFENDPPLFTPRIAACAKLDRKNRSYAYKMAIIQSATEPCSTQRFFFEFANPLSGQGHLIYTYCGKEEAEPKAFSQTPKLIKIPNNINSFLHNIWSSLNSKNKVSLFVEFLNLNTGNCIRKIINKNKKTERFCE